MLIWDARAYVLHAVLLVLFVLALRRGAAPERILTTTLLGMLVFDRIYHLITGQHAVMVMGVNLGHFAIDVIGLAVFVTVALSANRSYPLWIGGAQMVALSSHFYPLLAHDLAGTGYLAMSIMPSYAQTIAMGIGLASHMRRQKTAGSYRCWRTSSSPLQKGRPRTSPAA
ncbi:hypothetical protein EDF56_1011097 [Novosphingobium sp. PhB165]|uniref:hypothetical protein n=1 Tax=Novosphingobium sp. PhB165 TaxID=2485105 RepID=UPI001045E42E|nr:hypothetical protein [Novosphingobium sp. PhB165]TCM22407.1 hypothetical protein EDF56_1011097 [Novosphingobium sp. PhB165]